MMYATTSPDVLIGRVMLYWTTPSRKANQILRPVSVAAVNNPTVTIPGTRNEQYSGLIILPITRAVTSMSDRLRLINTAISHLVLKKYEKSVRATKRRPENSLKLP